MSSVPRVLLKFESNNLCVNISAASFGEYLCHWQMNLNYVRLFNFSVDLVFELDLLIVARSMAVILVHIDISQYKGGPKFSVHGSKLMTRLYQEQNCEDPDTFNLVYLFFIFVDHLCLRPLNYHNWDDCLSPNCLSVSYPNIYFYSKETFH